MSGAVGRSSTAALPSAPERLDVIASPDRAAALLDPLRRRLLEELREPDSAAGLARRLRLPRQRVNYHVRELEKRRLVELVGRRRRGNCTARILRATAQAYVISPSALGGVGADPAVVRDRFSAAYLVAVAARAVREVGELGARAEKAGRRLATLTLETEVRFASAEARAGFTEDLTRALARLTARYHDAEAPGGRAFRFLLAGYPAGPAPE
jgi:DNA-binding transcriptional ArsR family regulator